MGMGMGMGIYTKPFNSLPNHFLIRKSAKQGIITLHEMSPESLISRHLSNCIQCHFANPPTHSLFGRSSPIVAKPIYFDSISAKGWVSHYLNNGRATLACCRRD